MRGGDGETPASGSEQAIVGRGDSDAIAQEIFEFLRDYVLGEDDTGLTFDTPLLELGILDSLSAQRVFMFVEERYGVVLDDGDVLPSDFATIAKMSRLIQAKLATP